MTSEHLDEQRLERAERFEFDFDDRLDGRQVLVAGATGGLGVAGAARMLHDGADVLLGYHADDAEAERTVSGLGERYGGTVGALKADLTTDAGRRAIVEGVDPERFYGAVICVGEPSRVAAEAASVDDLQAALRINYTGPILLAHALGRDLLERDVAGALVLLSSMQGVEPFAGSLAYSGPKAALVHAARILAQDLAAVRVNVIAPGVNQAGMALSSIGRGKYDPFVDRGVIPRFGYPEDVARAAAFLMAPDNYVTGQTLLVDGGLTLLRTVK